MLQRICFKIRKFPILNNIRKIHYIGQDYYNSACRERNNKF